MTIREMLSLDDDDDGGSRHHAARGAPPDSTSSRRRVWTQEDSDKLQQAVTRVFGVAGQDLKGFQFSLTLADPLIEGCPLIGCSTGFGQLCGYEMEEIVGRNCRFLVDPVPEELINTKVRLWSRAFCDAAREQKSFRIPAEELEPWMPSSQPMDGGIFCAQTNARKDGSLFENLFYLRCFELNDQPYIAGLQTELPMGCLRGHSEPGSEEALAACHRACLLLDKNWAEVERVLASLFWFMGPMRRQDDMDIDDGYMELAELMPKGDEKKRDSEIWERRVSPEPTQEVHSHGADDGKGRGRDGAVAAKGSCGAWAALRCCWPQVVRSAATR